MEFSKSEKKKTPFSQKRFSASFCFSSLAHHSTRRFPKEDREKNRLCEKVSSPPPHLTPNFDRRRRGKKVFFLSGKMNCLVQGFF